jgi:predicted amidohydrolase
LGELDRKEEGFVIADIDLPHWDQERQWMGLMRDRRPALYGKLAE